MKFIIAALALIGAVTAQLGRPRPTQGQPCSFTNGNICMRPFICEKVGFNNARVCVNPVTNAGAYVVPDPTRGFGCGDTVCSYSQRCLTDIGKCVGVPQLGNVCYGHCAQTQFCSEGKCTLSGEDDILFEPVTLVKVSLTVTGTALSTTQETALKTAVLADYVALNKINVNDTDKLTATVAFTVSTGRRLLQGFQNIDDEDWATRELSTDPRLKKVQEDQIRMTLRAALSRARIRIAARKRSAVAETIFAYDVTISTNSTRILITTAVQSTAPADQQATITTAIDQFANVTNVTVVFRDRVEPISIAPPPTRPTMRPTTLQPTRSPTTMRPTVSPVIGQTAEPTAAPTPSTASPSVPPTGAPTPLQTDLRFQESSSCKNCTENGFLWIMDCTVFADSSTTADQWLGAGQLGCCRPADPLQTPVDCSEEQRLAGYCAAFANQCCNACTLQRKAWNERLNECKETSECPAPGTTGIDPDSFKFDCWLPDTGSARPRHPLSADLWPSSTASSARPTSGPRATTQRSSNLIFNYGSLFWLKRNI